jgi:hypothetical protein
MTLFESMVENDPEIHTLKVWDGVEAEQEGWQLR